MVYALDASNGKLLWKYDPEVYRGIQGSGCCDAANRGVAVWKGRVYVGVYDGRLVALDARTGRKAWSVDTVIDHERNYTITGAPRVVKGKAIIGIGVSSRTEALSITAFAKPQQGGCAGVLVSLLDIDTSHKDVDVPATTEDPDSVGWCLYRVETPAYEKKVYLLIDNNTGDDLVVDDAVVRVLPTKSAPPPPPPMGPMEGARLLRHEEAKAAILAHRLPVLPPKDKDPVKRAFEEHLSR